VDNTLFEKKHNLTRWSWIWYKRKSKKYRLKEYIDDKITYLFSPFFIPYAVQSLPVGKRFHGNSCTLNQRRVIRNIQGTSLC